MQVDVGGFFQNVNLVESCHDVGVDGEYTVLFPCYHIVVVVDRVYCRLSEIVGPRELIGYDVETSRTERFGFGYHTPQDACKHILLEELGVVGHGYKSYRMCVQRCLVGRTLGDEIVVDGQV